LLVVCNVQTVLY